MMTFQKVVALVPLLAPPSPDQEWKKKFVRLVEQLTSLSGRQPGNVTLGSVTHREPEPALLEELDIPTSRRSIVLEFEIVLQAPDVLTATSSDGDTSIINDTGTIVDILCSNLEYWLSALFLASGISIPGAAQVLRGRLTHNGNRCGRVESFDSCEFQAAVDDRVDDWPPIWELSVADVNKWLWSIPGFSEGVGITPVGRALAAFSYLTVRHEMGHFDLLSALIGLEAIFGQGSTSVGSQLVDKAAVLFGISPAKRRRITSSYNLRSRLVHGDANISYSFSQFDAVHEFERIEVEAMEHTSTAVALLLSTLQTMAAKGAINVSFDYDVNFENDGV